MDRTPETTTSPAPATGGGTGTEFRAAAQGASTERRSRHREHTASQANVAPGPAAADDRGNWLLAV